MPSALCYKKMTLHPITVTDHIAVLLWLFICLQSSIFLHWAFTQFKHYIVIFSFSFDKILGAELQGYIKIWLHFKELTIFFQDIWKYPYILHILVLIPYYYCQNL